MIVWLPWLLINHGNLYNCFGLTYFSKYGTMYKEKQITFFEIFLWTTACLSYIVLMCCPFLPFIIYYFKSLVQSIKNSKNNKNEILLIISFLLILCVLVYIVVRHALLSPYNYDHPERINGRYLLIIYPFIYIFFIIGLKRFLSNVENKQININHVKYFFISALLLFLLSYLFLVEGLGSSLIYGTFVSIFDCDSFLYRLWHILLHGQYFWLNIIGFLILITFYAIYLFLIKNATKPKYIFVLIIAFMLIQVVPLYAYNRYTQMSVFGKAIAESVVNENVKNIRLTNLSRYKHLPNHVLELLADFYLAKDGYKIYVTSDLPMKTKQTDVIQFLLSNISYIESDFKLVKVYDFKKVRYYLYQYCN